MIDLHAHVLPGIDDGPGTQEASLALARDMAASGIHLVTATPHLRSDHPAVRLEELRDRAQALDAALADAGIGLRVLPGAEVDILWARAASPIELDRATYAQRGTDLLLETPYGPLPDGFNREVERLISHGLRIVLAHPERNPTFQRRPQLVLDLVARGVLVQVTAMSLGRTDRKSRSGPLARWLVERGAAHVIATDAHAAGAWRGPSLEPAVSALAALAPSRVEWMLHEVPQAIVAGEPLPAAPALSGTGTPGLRGPRLRRLLARG